jgi:hypothetical protein
MPSVQKTVSQAMTRGASTIIIVFLGLTLGIFLVLRIFDSSRLIHMQMEISLLLAHACLLPDLSGDENACRTISILVHFFFTACFTFMLLEALHMYALVAWVVKREGMLAKAQNIFVGKLCSVCSMKNRLQTKTSHPEHKGMGTKQHNSSKV